MKTNNYQKRPKSGRQNNKMPSSAIPTIEKTEETLVETITYKNKKNNQEYSEKKITESDEENYNKSDEIFDKSRSSIEKLEFLDSLAKGSRKDSFINLLDEEAQRIDKISEKKKKINGIGLKENDIEGLYDWKALFNHSRPMSHYTRVNYKKPIKKEEIEINNKIKSPKVLVDLPNDKMMYFFGKNAFGNIETDESKKKNKNSSTFRKSNNYNTSNANINKTHNSNITNKKYMISLKTTKTEKEDEHEDKDKNDNIKNKNKKDNENGHNYIKPISLYGQHGPEDTFYFSNAFSDYYNEDFKSFTNKMPLLKAKVKTNPSRLKKAIKKQRIKSSNKEKILYDTIMTDPLYLKKHDLIISAERRNPVPLLKSIYKQENPDAVEIKENVKKYFNTMKPFGNDDGTTDYTKNDRWRLSRELIKIKRHINDNDFINIEENKNGNENNYNYRKKGKRRLILSYYNKNDPDIQRFNNLHLDENRIKNISFEFKGDNIDNTYKFQIEVKNGKEEEEEKNISLNIRKEEKKDNNNLKLKKRPRTGFKRSKDINILNKEKIRRALASKRPHSSNIRRKNNLSENKIFDINDLNELYKDYLHSNRFPVKTSSKVTNTSYNRINEMLKERQNKKISAQYFMTEPGFPTHTLAFETFNPIDDLNFKKIKNDKKSKIRPKTSSSLRSNSKKTINSDNKNDDDNKEQKYNYLDFNNYIDINHDLDLPEKSSIQLKGYYGPMNCFNKLAGKYYSSSNNFHVKNRRNKKKTLLNTYYYRTFKKK